MTERRMNRLLCELNLPENSVYIPDAESILKGVKNKINSKVNEEKKEKALVWGFKLSRVVAVAVIIVLTLALTTVAFGKDGVIRKIITIFEEPATEETIPTEEKVIVSNPPTEIPTELPTEIETEPKVNPKYVSPIFDKYHQGDVEQAEEFLQNVYGSVEDENFILTVNEVLGDATNMYLTVTVEAKNNEANSLLMAGGYSWIKIEAYSEKEERWMNAGGGTSELFNERRENSRSFSMHVFGDSDRTGGYSRIRVTCDGFSETMEGERYVYFEMEKSRDRIELEFLGQSFSGGKITITPMGLSVVTKREEIEIAAREARNLNIFFKFKNGSIKSFNQVASFDTTMSYVIGSDNLYSYETGVRSVIDIESLESVIVKGIEYPLDNPENYSYASVPERLKPFKLTGVWVKHGDYYYACRVSQLSSCLNITYQGDDTLEFSYGGKKYKIQAGNGDVIINDSSTYQLQVPIYQDTNGEMWVGMDFVEYLLGMRYGQIGETGEYWFVP